MKRTLALLDDASAEAIGNLRDILDGHPSELETEIGTMVRFAKAVGIEVPHHAFLYAGLLPQECKTRGVIQFPVAENDEPGNQFRAPAVRN